MCQVLRAPIGINDPEQPHQGPLHTHGLALFKPNLGVLCFPFLQLGVEGCKFGERAELLFHAGRPELKGSLAYILAVLEIKAPSWIVGTHLMEEQLFGRKRLGGEKSSWCEKGKDFIQQMCFWER